MPNTQWQHEKATIQARPEKIFLLDVQVSKQFWMHLPNLWTLQSLLFVSILTSIEEIAHSTEDKRVRIRLHVNITAFDEAQKLISGIQAAFGIDCHFFVENLEEMLHQVPDGGESLQFDFGVTLFGMAYSTSRGIVLERTHGTIMGGVILPVVNPVKILMPPKVEF